MTSRWSVIAMLLFWLTSMSWLVQQKVLPSLLIGEPPNYRKILDAQRKEVARVGWILSLNDRPFGTSNSETRRRPDGVTEIVSQTRIDRAPLHELAPAVYASIAAMFGGRELANRGFSFWADTTIEVDALGRPISLRAKADVGPPRGPGAVAETRTEYLSLGMTGIVQGSTLKLRVNSGDVNYTTSIAMPNDALFGDMLSPQGALPDLRVGQRWTFPTYNPFRSPSNAVEILEAVVSSKGTMTWNGERRAVYIVAVRNVPGFDLSTGQETKGRMWVDTNGVVLKQEMILMNSRIGFLRLPDSPLVDTPPAKAPTAAETP